MLNLCYDVCLNCDSLGVTQLEIFTLTLTLSLKGEGMIELRKSYSCNQLVGQASARPRPWVR